MILHCSFFLYLGMREISFMLTDQLCQGMKDKTFLHSLDAYDGNLYTPCYT